MGTQLVPGTRVTEDTINASVNDKRMDSHMNAQGDVREIHRNQLLITVSFSNSTKKSRKKILNINK